MKVNVLYVVKVLVALASDLGLDTLPCCAEAHKWAWFRRYCSAARVAAAIVKRTALPQAFLDEVGKKVMDIASDGEPGSLEYLDNEVFNQEQDEQLLQWLNRCVKLKLDSHSVMRNLDSPFCNFLMPFAHWCHGRQS